MNLLEIDNSFNYQYKNLLETQAKIKKQLEHYSFDLAKDEITQAIINRMDAFWYFNVNNNKNILGRKTNTTAADFFTETCLLFLKSYYEQNKYFKVVSEKNISKGKVIRPDISIWKNDEVVAVIELKVSNGWRGKYIIPHLLEREEKIRVSCPIQFFGVIAFWNFFNNESNGWNNKYIGLKSFNEKESHPRTDATVENLIKSINEILQRA